MPDGSQSLSAPQELTRFLHTHLADFETTTSHLLRPIEARALLNFSALFNEVMYIPDTAIGDNHLIIESFEKEGHSGLFAQIRRFIEEKLLYVLCRDKVAVGDKILVPKDPTIREIFEGWRHRDQTVWSGDTGFTTIINEDLRFAYYREFDDLLIRQNAIYRYDPDIPKSSFRERIRAQLNSDHPNTLAQSVGKLPSEIQKRYFAAVKDRWFTNAELWRVLKQQSPLASEQIILHAHVNQQCFADLTSSGQSGHDRSTNSLASFNLELQRRRPLSLETDATLVPPENLQELLDSAPVKLMSPGIDMFAKLSMEEVLRIRRRAAPLFELARRPRQAGDDNTVRSDFLKILETYWNHILTELELKYPEQMRQPARAGLFVESQLPTLTQLYKKFGKGLFATLLRVSLNPPLQLLATPLADGTHQLLDHIGFVFLQERTELNDQLRSVVPPTQWYPRGILGLDCVTSARPYRW